MKILNSKKVMTQKNYTWYEITYINNKDKKITMEFGYDSNTRDIMNYDCKSITDRKSIEDKFIIDFIFQIKETAAEKAKAYGIKDLKKVSKMTGQSTQTLNNWFNNKRHLFEIILIGCKKMEGVKYNEE